MVGSCFFVVSVVNSGLSTETRIFFDSVEKSVMFAMMVCQNGSDVANNFLMGF